MDNINADDAEFGMSDHKTHNELRAEIAGLRAAARQDAEEKARLLAVLCSVEAVLDSDPKWAFGVTHNKVIDAIAGDRAALACRPQGEKSDVP